MKALAVATCVSACALAVPAWAQDPEATRIPYQ